MTTVHKNTATSLLTEAAGEEGKAVVTFAAKMHLLSFFDLFSSFSIQHTTVQEAWYTSHVGPLILLPVNQGMERQKKNSKNNCLYFFFYFH